MMRMFWLLILSLAFYGCGSDGEGSSSANQVDGDDEKWVDDADDAIQTGSLLIDLPGERGSGRATCNINLTELSMNSWQTSFSRWT